MAAVQWLVIVTAFVGLAFDPTGGIPMSLRVLGCVLLLGLTARDLLRYRLDARDRAAGRDGRVRRSSQRVRLTMPACVALGIMCILFIGSMIGRSNTLLLVAAMIAGPFVVNGWLAHVMLRRIDVARRSSSRTSVGEPLSVELELTNRKRWFATWLATVRDEIASEEESLDAEVVFTRTPAGSTSRGRYELRPMRRGRYVLGPISVRTSFPFGFVERRQRFEARSTIVVRPRIGRLTAAWRRGRRASDSRVKVDVPRDGGADDEFQRLREFREGDGIRRIHWRTSARRRELMVRDDRTAHAPPYTLLVDLWQPAEPDDAALDRVELAVGFVATLCVDQLTRNRDTELEIGLAGATPQHWRGRSGPAGIESLLDELAVVRAGTETGFAPLAGGIVTAAGPRSAIVLVTTRPRAALARLIADLPLDAQRRLAEARVVEAMPDELERHFSYA